MSVREHVLRIVYQELVRLIWATTDVRLEPQVILMATGSEVYLCGPAVAAASAIGGRIVHPDEVAEK